MSNARNPTPERGSCRARALCIGINYTGTPYALKGCINDAANSHSVFTQMATTAGYGTVDSRLLTDNAELVPTRKEIVRSLAWLTEGAKAGDVLWFHFSGHGSQMDDKDGDEEDGKDETICTMDGQMVTDDELKRMLCGRVGKGVTLYCVFDCCHSGTIVDLRYVWDEDSDEFIKDTHNAPTKANVFMISGCLNVQTSADLPAGFRADVCEDVGALTNALLKFVQKGWAWNRLIPHVRSELRETKLQQIPQFETGKREADEAPAFACLLPLHMTDQAVSVALPSGLPEAANAHLTSLQELGAGDYEDDDSHYSAELPPALAELLVSVGTNVTDKLGSLDRLSAMWLPLSVSFGVGVVVGAWLFSGRAR